jgi:D-alanyl-D-alanine dipeptidase
MSPRFDEPCLTRPAQQVLAEHAVEVPETRPLPDLSDPDALPVTHPVDEPMIEVSHERIILLHNYRKAGWVHTLEGCWLRRSVADLLTGVADSLPDRWGLAVFDAWRPLELQVELYEAALADPTVPTWLFAEPDPERSRPPPHLSGGAVDLTLTHDGVALAPGTGFDDMTPLAGASALEDVPGPDREMRRLLFWSMRNAGFVVFNGEWWHFEYGTRRWGAITGRQPIFGPAVPPA